VPANEQRPIRRLPKIGIIRYRLRYLYCVCFVRTTRLVIILVGGTGLVSSRLGFHDQSLIFSRFGTSSDYNVCT